MPNILKNLIRDVKFGKDCTVIEPVNLFECDIGNNVFIGPFVEIGKKVKIGDNSRISSHTYICEKVEIGKNCFVGHGVMFTNDKFSDGKINFNNNEWLKTLIEDNVLIGSNATILPVNICSNVVIGSGAVVTKDIKKKGIYAGNPAKFLKDI
ncbi:N-acetyltransferase [Candidatus Pelagibacter sp.]|nr:N-acetyltransferase [Candidatus Pelagibacter sp.]|tara:strand:+ start:104 stop:559 length:456 start_codon:yes stop_codon:yes gene_type:complete